MCIDAYNQSSFILYTRFTYSRLLVDNVMVHIALITILSSKVLSSFPVKISMSDMRKLKSKSLKPYKFNQSTCRYVNINADEIQVCEFVRRTQNLKIVLRCDEQQSVTY